MTQDSTNNDTIYFHTGHSDTIIENQHIIIDTFISRDTVYVETQTFDKEIQIIEKLIDRPDFSKDAVSILVVIFVAYTIIKKWKK
tara:strand:+ start:7411 stop:7665 length:255 start_codon:yes stop_codon:yes gene_type:complete